MERVSYRIEIAAPPEKVWDVMLAQDTYREWTEPFSPGSHFVGGWETGDKILFLSADAQQGMVSRIAESRRPQLITIEHMGIVENGVEVTEGEKAAAWAPSTEEYVFEPTPQGTRLHIAMDSAPEYVHLFDEKWPVALARLKALAES